MTNRILKQFKDESGNVNFPLVLSVPLSERLPELAKRDFHRINMLIVGALTIVFEGLNLKRGLNEIQILDLSEAIIDTSNEDNLSMEDLMLFLQKFARGEYKVSYENMNVPKFMEVFEMYREDRFQKLKEYQMERHYKYKNMGDGNRTTKSDPLSEHFASLGERMSSMKNTISNLKQENYSLKMDKE